MRRTLLVPPIAVAALAVPLAGCPRAAPDSQGPEPAVSPGAATASDSTCVTDPEAVVAAQHPVIFAGMSDTLGTASIPPPEG